MEQLGIFTSFLSTKLVMLSRDFHPLCWTPIFPRFWKRRPGDRGGARGRPPPTVRTWKEFLRNGGHRRRNAEAAIDGQRVVGDGREASGEQLLGSGCLDERAGTEGTARRQFVVECWQQQRQQQHFQIEISSELFQMDAPSSRWISFEPLQWKRPSKTAAPANAAP